jgi:hypothetical protein
MSISIHVQFRVDPGNGHTIRAGQHQVQLGAHITALIFLLALHSVVLSIGFGQENPSDVFVSQVHSADVVKFCAAGACSRKLGRLLTQSNQWNLSVLLQVMGP